MPLLVVAGCGSGTDPVRVGAALRGARPLAAEVVAVGENDDFEPSPIGTLVTGPSPADHFWVQALSTEGYEAFAAEADEVTHATAKRVPVEGMTQLAIRAGDRRLLIGSRAGADPGTAASMAFDLSHLPPGVRFVPTSSNAVTGAQFVPGEDPVELLTRGSLLIEVAMGDGSVQTVISVPGPAEGLAGLLRGLRIVRPGTYAGEMSPGVHVVIFDHPATESAVVAIDPPSADALIETGPAIVAAAATASAGG